MNGSGPKILQIGSKNEDIPDAYFFPTQHIGPIGHITDATSNMVVRLRCGENVISSDSDAEVNVLLPQEIMTDGSFEVIVIFTEDNPLSKLYPRSLTISGEEKEQILRRYAGDKECSKLIHQAGIVRVVFSKAYRDTSGIEFLKKAGIDVTHITDLD